MVDVIYILNGKELPAEVFNRLEALLPEVFHGSFLRYRRWQDRQAGLFGKLLLRQLLIRNGLSPSLLASYQTDDYDRPSINFTGDFNISHTEGMVIVVLTSDRRIGIDIERKKDIDPLEFGRVFTQEEATYIGGGAQSRDRFFKVWTKKEAAMKADGRGFFLDAAAISTLSASVRIGKNIWETTPLKTTEQYFCYLSAKKHGKEIDPEEVTVFDLV